MDNNKRHMKNALAFLMELWSDRQAQTPWLGDLDWIMEKEIEHGVTDDLLATIEYLHQQVGEWPDIDYWRQLDD